MAICRKNSAHLKVLHSEVDSIGIAIGDLQITRPGRSSTDHKSIILSPKIIDVDVLANMGIRNERLDTVLASECMKHQASTYDTLGSHEIQSSLNDRLVEFHAI